MGVREVDALIDLRFHVLNTNTRASEKIWMAASQQTCHDEVASWLQTLSK